MSIAGKLSKSELIGLWFAGLAKADLVWGDNPIASVSQNVNCVFPCCGTEIFTVQKHSDPPVGMLGPDIHVGHV